MLIKLLITLTLVWASAIAQDERFQEIFRWNSIGVVWPSDEARDRASASNGYIAENNAIAGIKIWKGRMYLTVPRWKTGVPVTLGVTSAKPMNRINGTGIDYAPKLEAYPSWEMQEIGDCRAFQFVQSMEIDPKGRMWVLDTGRTETMTDSPKSRCPPRLVILDLEKNGEILRSYAFPDTVSSPTNSYLNDIVLDQEDGGFAYITDNSRIDPGIIVYSLMNGTSWKIRDTSMRAEQDAVGFMIGSVRVMPPINVDGIALSPASVRDRYVYYSPLSSFHLYALPTSVLKSNETKNLRRHVRDWGLKISQTDGMMMSSTGILYYGSLADDSISKWDTLRHPSFAEGQRLISRDHEKMQWPDTFAFDEYGYLYCITNSLQNFINNRVNVNVPNYRVIRLATPGVKSYQYYDDSKAPELPVIVAGADRVSVALGTCLVILLTCLLQ